MHTTALTIGEVEHGGDVRFTTRQLSGIEGVESVEFKGHTGPFSGRFEIEHTFPRSELKKKLAAAQVCY